MGAARNRRTVGLFTMTSKQTTKTSGQFSSYTSVLGWGALAALLTGCAAEDGRVEDEQPNAGVSQTEAPAETTETTDSTSQSLSGMTCAASASDDNYICIGIELVNCINQTASNYEYCFNQGTRACTPLYTVAKRWCVLHQNRIYSVLKNGFHNETKVYVGGTVEMHFDLSQTPYPGADPKPIYRCGLDGTTTKYNGGFRDFPSKDPNCEGKGAPTSILGYSVTSTTARAKALYRCRTGSDHFLSTSSTCEGKTFEGLIGYGVF